MPRRNQVKVWVTLLALTAFPLPFLSANDTNALCARFGELLSRRGGLSPYELEMIPSVEGSQRIPNIDVDKDGRADDLVWFCPGSGSRAPADPCTLSIALSSGRKIEFEESRFHLIRYQSNVYAVAAESGPSRTIGTGRIYRVDGSGVTLVCSKL